MNKKGADMKKLIANHTLNTLRLGLLGTLLLLGFVLSGLPDTAMGAGAKNRVEFDHLKTGFPLDGVHSRLKCEECHVQGVFKGTPTKCSICHSPGSRTASSSKPARHVPTALPCENCHTSAVSWSGARFMHTDVRPGTCSSCHGLSASGKPNNHIQTTAQCDTCHRTSAWIPAAYNHANVQPGDCKSCHGVTATGKPGNHIPTNDSCDVCHRTTTFVGAHFHANVQATPGTCSTCHGGRFPNVASKPNPHVATTAECDTCHITSAWGTGNFNHVGVQPGTCSGCHGVTAKGKPGNHIPTTASCDLCHRVTGQFLDGRYHANVQATPGGCATNCHGINPNVRAKPTGHFVTSRSCDACHTTVAWLPTSKYTHTSPDYRQHNAGVTCANCHGTPGSEVIAWKFSAYKPDCAGCHAAKFKADSHKKTTSPTTILYTVAELRNCSGSCHEYTDNTFTTIKTNRSSKHRPTDGGF
jgi:hypothetical protein